MKILQIRRIALVGAILGALPYVAFAQQSQFSGSYAAMSEVCTNGNGGAENRSACYQSLLPVLSEIRLATDGARYDSEISAIALALVNGYTSLTSPPLPVCSVIADALGEVGQSADDPAQSTQVFAIAARIRACVDLSGGIERLLASPN